MRWKAIEYLLGIESAPAIEGAIEFVAGKLLNTYQGLKESGKSPTAENLVCWKAIEYLSGIESGGGRHGRQAGRQASKAGKLLNTYQGLKDKG